MTSLGTKTSSPVSRPLWALTAGLALVTATACSSTARERSSIDTRAGRGSPGETAEAGETEAPVGDDRLSASRRSVVTSAAPKAARRTNPANATPGAVTERKPLKLGMEYQAFVDGYPTVVFPDSKGYAQAVLDDLNRRGGLNGHPVEPVFYGYTSGNFAAEEQASCTRFTEDNHVVAVVGKSFGHTDTFLACLAKAGVPYIESGVLQHDSVEMDRFPLYFNSSNIRLDRSAPILINALAAQGYFAKGSRVGLLTYDDPAYERILDPIRKTLARHGMSLRHIERLSNDLDSLNEMPAAVMRLKNAGIDRLIVRFVNVDYFMRTAETQGYRPVYGLASDNFPATARQNVPAEQLRGARGVGWIPAVDVDDPGDPSTLGRSDRCFKIMFAAGATMGDGNSRRIAQITCEVVWLLEEGAARAGALSGDDIRRGIESLGTSFVPASTFAARLGPGRHDGATGVRHLAYGEDCACFRYTSGVFDAG